MTSYLIWGAYFAARAVRLLFSRKRSIWAPLALSEATDFDRRDCWLSRSGSAGLPSVCDGTSSFSGSPLGIADHPIWLWTSTFIARSSGRSGGPAARGDHDHHRLSDRNDARRGICVSPAL